MDFAAGVSECQIIRPDSIEHLNVASQECFVALCVYPKHFTFGVLYATHFLTSSARMMAPSLTTVLCGAVSLSGPNVVDKVDRRYAIRA